MDCLPTSLSSINPYNNRYMNVLVIDEDDESFATIAGVLGDRSLGPVHRAFSLQEGIEVLEDAPDSVKLAVCNYRGKSKSLVELFARLSGDLPAIFFIDDSADAGLAVSRRVPLQMVSRNDWASFAERIEENLREGVLESKNIPDSEFLRVATKALSLNRPLAADIYLRLGSHRYCKRFRREDAFDAEDLQRGFHSRGVEYLYVHKSEFDVLMAGLNHELDQISADPDLAAEDAMAAAEDQLAVVHDVVGRIGFSPQVQELTKKIVEVTLRAIGSSPSLAELAQRMKVQEGKYISSHSLMLAEIACAIACRVGWSSSSSYMKLTLAAFLHDLSLTNNRLARMRRVSDVTEANGFTTEDGVAFRQHPIAAAEFARSLHQVPPDVDTIVLQHHEQPDGSGFPRGLFHQQISPLATIFVIAHDLLDYFLEFEGGNPSTNLFESFFEDRETFYAAGTFKKIQESLRTGKPLEV